MKKFLDRVRTGEVLVSDGATGTYLQVHGLEPGGCPEEFNLSHPEIVRQMASDYFEAGSDLVLTNSFGGSAYRLKEYGLNGRVEEVNRLAAEHARSVAPNGRYVLGSIGPVGVLLEPNGPATEKEVFDAFCEQVRGLSAGGVDGFCVETMFDLGRRESGWNNHTAGLADVCSDQLWVVTLDLGRRAFRVIQKVEIVDRHYLRRVVGGDK